MTTTYLGSLSIGNVVPGAAGVAVAGVAGINAALPNLDGQLNALLSFSPTPIDFAAQIATLQSMITGIQLSISLGVPPPSLSVQLANLAALIAALQALVNGMNVQLDIITAFQALLGAAGIHAYAYAGQAGNLGPELSAQLAGGTPGGAPTDAANALVLVTTVPATWAAMAQIFEVGA